jgi:hypothetical protein
MKKILLWVGLVVGIALQAGAQSADTSEKTSDTVTTRILDSSVATPVLITTIDSNLALSPVRAINIDSIRNLTSIMIAIDTLRPFRRPALDRKYGTLLDDDPAYNPKYPWWVPAVRVVAATVTTWAIDRYLFNYDWSRIGPSTWKYNIKKGWEWDNDRFGVNFVGHPYSGSIYFNVARSHGYNFWQSFPYAVGGSLIWEYFGENTRPSINDVINTPVSGAFLGEILYRLSSSILDDRTRGGERVFREIAAGIVDPSRAFARFTQGKMFRVTPYEVYQKEPMNITLNLGANKINNNQGNENKFASGGTNAIVDMQIDYGDPFEVRYRKPFDFFRGRLELGYGTNKYIISTVNGYGLLAGRTIKNDRLLSGLFQHYDYWHNNIFEVGALGFGYGLVSNIPAGQHSNFYSAIHLAVVPLAGNNTHYGPDTSDYRFYNFGGGMEAKVEETVNLGKWLSLGFSSFFYWIHTYNGIPGNSLVQIIKPAVALKLFKNTSIGFEHELYHNDRYSSAFSPLHLTRTQQKVYLQLFLGNRKRRDDYH